MNFYCCLLVENDVLFEIIYYYFKIFISILVALVEAVLSNDGKHGWMAFYWMFLFSSSACCFLNDTLDLILGG